VKKILARIGVLWAGVLLAFGVAFPQTLIEGQTVTNQKLIVQVNDAGQLLVGGSVIISLGDGGLVTLPATVNSFNCVNLTCGPTPTTVTLTPGQFGSTFSSLLTSNPPVVIGSAGSVDAGSGDLLLAYVADLTIPINGGDGGVSPSLSCETFESDGGALVSVCARGP
jgi:hypothetical protein